jgi:hypothetical protein
MTNERRKLAQAVCEIAAHDLAVIQVELQANVRSRYFAEHFCRLCKR